MEPPWLLKLCFPGATWKCVRTYFWPSDVGRKGRDECCTWEIVTPPAWISDVSMDVDGGEKRLDNYLKLDLNCSMCITQSVWCAAPTCTDFPRDHVYCVSWEKIAFDYVQKLAKNCSQHSDRGKSLSPMATPLVTWEVPCSIAVAICAHSCLTLDESVKI